MTCLQVTCQTALREQHFKTMTRISFRAALAFGLGIAVLPVLGYGISAPAAIAQSVADSTPVAPVQILYKALDAIQKAHGSFAERSQMLAPAVDQSYDLTAVLKASVGLRYNALNDDEKQKLLAAFRNYTIARYVSSFKPGSDVQFSVSPTVADAPAGGGKIVVTHVGGDDGSAPTELSYIVHQENGSWRITDVLLSDAHISQAAAQRADFSSTLASGGVTGLIAVLERKVQNYSTN